MTFTNMEHCRSFIAFASIYDYTRKFKFHLIKNKKKHAAEILLLLIPLLCKVNRMPAIREKTKNFPQSYFVTKSSPNIMQANSIDTPIMFHVLLMLLLRLTVLLMGHTSGIRG